MHITIEHFGGERPQFNVGIASKEGVEPFLVIKGCRIMDGSKGPFVSLPATKNQATGKYWNHAWFSEKFAQAVMEKAQATQAPKARSQKASGGGSRRDEFDDETIPF